MKNERNDLYMILAAEIGGKPNIFVALSDVLVKEKGLNASQIIKELAKEIEQYFMIRNANAAEKIQTINYIKIL